MPDRSRTAHKPQTADDVMHIVAVVVLVILFVMTALHVSSVMAEETPPALPGIIHGTGTSFAINDSNYLNISVTSTAEIDLHLNSFPTIIDMTIAASVGATSTDITLGGLEANTTYWMYHDNSIDSVKFTADASGNYSFTQDLHDPHTIRIKPGQSTVVIYDGGVSGTGYMCTTVGTWDEATKTCSLTQDVNDSITIYGVAGVTLEGAGFQVNLPSWGEVLVIGNHPTIKNLKINGSEAVYSPYLCSTYGGSYCDILPTGYGVHVQGADSVTVTNVTVSNTYIDLFLEGGVSNSTFSDSTFSGVSYGASLDGYYNQYYCDIGYKYYCGISGNTVSDNTFSGTSTRLNASATSISARSQNNTIRGNTFSKFHDGVTIRDMDCQYGLSYPTCATGNTVYQNNFINNYFYQIFTYGRGDNAFNLSAPDGGNYYSVFDEPVEGCSDGDGDGFCDNPYSNTFPSWTVTDYLPWTTQDGWVNQAPTAYANGPYLIAVGGTVELDGSASSDPDGDTLTETWTADGGTVSGNTYTAGDVPGVYDVTLIVNDGTVDSEPVTTTVVVYDPSGGFVTGGGWINSPEGAYAANPLLTGKANFGFVSKYKKGATTPTGETQFQFSAGDLNFHSDSYEWLVVNQGGDNAQYKGTGTINDGLAPTGEAYNFMLWANDGDNADSVEPDTFRIKIWYVDDYDNDVVVYDNGFDQEVSGGSIVIHTGK